MRCGRKSLRPPSGVDPIPPLLHHWTQRVYAVLIGVTAASRYLRHVLRVLHRDQVGSRAPVAGYEDAVSGDANALRFIPLIRSSFGGTAPRPSIARWKPCESLASALRSLSPSAPLLLMLGAFGTGGRSIRRDPVQRRDVWRS
jgi:hypothetical protein